MSTLLNRKETHLLRSRKAETYGTAAEETRIFIPLPSLDLLLRRWTPSFITQQAHSAEPLEQSYQSHAVYLHYVAHINPSLVPHMLFLLPHHHSLSVVSLLARSPGR